MPDIRIPKMSHHKASNQATTSSVLDRWPAALKAPATSISLPGGTTSLKKWLRVRATNSVRVCTKMVAALVRTGKNDRIDE